MTRKVVVDGLELFECERCDCVVGVVDTAHPDARWRDGSYLTDSPAPRAGCECSCHDTYHMMRKVPE